MLSKNLFNKFKIFFLGNFIKHLIEFYEKKFTVKKKIKEFQIDEKFINENSIFEIIEPLSFSVSFWHGIFVYKKDLFFFNKEQKYVFAIYTYINEVSNGSHWQFHFNSTGIVWEDALTGLNELGLTKTSEILLESVIRIYGFPSKNITKRKKQFLKFKPRFTDLDQRFYQVVEVTLIKLNEYIRLNKEKFYFKEEINGYGF